MASDFGVPMAASSPLADLALLMNTNMQQASHFFSQTAFSPEVIVDGSAISVSSADMSVETEDIASSSPSPSSEIEAVGVTRAMSFSSPLATASLTMSLPSWLPLVPSALKSLTPPSVPVPHAAVPMAGHVAPSRRRAAAVPSQVKCHAPVPVASASKVLSSQALSDPMPPRSFRSNLGSTTSFPDLMRLPAKENGYRNPGGAAGGLRKAVVMWFRNDLRLHDNEAFAAANGDALSVLPVYCFDSREYGKSSSGFDKTGPYRAKFLTECVADLRNNLRERGSDLIIRVGRPEDVLVELAKQVGAEAVYAHQETTKEETQAEKDLTAALKEEGMESKFFWGSTLYHVDDLPFASLAEMPTSYAAFKDLTRAVKVRDVADSPQSLKAFPAQGRVEVGDIPTPQDLGVSVSALQATAAQGNGINGRPGGGLLGGESEGLRKLGGFVESAAGESVALQQQQRKQQQTGGVGAANGSLLGANFSCKISPWLAAGCLSPRRMYHDLQAAAGAAGAGPDSNGSAVDDKSPLSWLVFELLWRDFFRFISKKYSATERIGAPAMAPA
eukprot:TRINITY_DN6759_c0_g1_i1.p1 TRINITY_DN6759_c0_g1~~TRINITY_DN6759_c0_g1_i1.p1  ORF type:complete len:558 (-),score=118.63 TRINITY_DN6759_c0_g1_i1:627-2300(-)